MAWQTYIQSQPAPPAYQIATHCTFQLGLSDINQYIAVELDSDAGLMTHTLGKLIRPP